MNYKRLKNRRSIRLKDYNYSQPGAYFVTMVAQNRKRLFGRIENGEIILNEFGKIVERAWMDLTSHYSNVKLDSHIIMPDHFHGIIVIFDPVEALMQFMNYINALNCSNNENRSREFDLSNVKYRRKMTLPLIIGRFKMVSAKRINLLRGTTGVRVWQRDYYERVIRNENELNRIRRYIVNNPDRKPRKRG